MPLLTWQQRYPREFSTHQNAIEALSEKQQSTLATVLDYLFQHHCLNSALVTALLQNDTYEIDYLLSLAKMLRRYNMLSLATVENVVKNDIASVYLANIEKLEAVMDYVTPDLIRLIIQCKEPFEVLSLSLVMTSMYELGFDASVITHYINQTKHLDGLLMAIDLMKKSSYVLNQSTLSILDKVASITSLPLMRTIYDKRRGVQNAYSRYVEQVTSDVADEAIGIILNTFMPYPQKIQRCFDLFAQFRFLPASQPDYMFFTVHQAVSDEVDKALNTLITQVKTATSFRWTYSNILRVRQLANDIKKLKSKLPPEESVELADEMDIQSDEDTIQYASVESTTSVETTHYSALAIYNIEKDIMRLRSELSMAAQPVFKLDNLIYSVASEIEDNDRYSCRSFKELVDEILSAFIDVAANIPDPLPAMKKTKGYRALIDELILGRGAGMTMFHRRRLPNVAMPQAHIMNAKPSAR